MGWRLNPKSATRVRQWKQVKPEHGIPVKINSHPVKSMKFLGEILVEKYKICQINNYKGVWGKIGDGYIW